MTLHSNNLSYSSTPSSPRQKLPSSFSHPIIHQSSQFPGYSPLPPQPTAVQPTQPLAFPIHRVADSQALYNQLLKCQCLSWSRQMTGTARLLKYKTSKCGSPHSPHRTVELWINQCPEPSETLDVRTRHFGPHLGRSKSPGRNIWWLIFFSVWWSLR